MLDLSERIRDYVDSACPTVTLDEIERMQADLSDRVTSDQRPRATRVPLALVSAVAIVALAIVLVVQLLPGSGPSSSEAGAVLARTALVAAAQPAGVTPGAGQYLYYETTEVMPGFTSGPVGVRHFLFEDTVVTQTWVAPNGSGRQRISTGQARLVFPDQEAAWQAAGSPKPLLGAPGVTDTLYPSSRVPSGGPLVTSHGQYRLAYLDTSKFPTEPDALQHYMDQYFQIDNGSRSATFLLAGSVLQVGATPALRSAIFRLIGQLPGVVSLGPTKDAAGRRGIGVALDANGNRNILVFNPTTSAVLGLKFVSNKKVGGTELAIPKGVAVASTTYGAAGVTASTSVLPNGWPAPPLQTSATPGTPSEAQFAGPRG